MIKVKSTTDYDQFKLMVGNRPIGKRVNKIIRAISRKNMLADFPILCKKNGDGKKYILDGQTRFEAAKALGLPVFYIENENVDLDDIPAANNIQTPWTMRDFVSSYARLGNQDYIKLEAFAGEFCLPLSSAASLLSGLLNNNSRAIKDGKFKVKTEKAGRQTAGVLVALRTYVRFAKEVRLSEAILKCLSVRGFDPIRFLEKVSKQQTKFVKCATWQQYVAMIEEIYNYHARYGDLIALSIEVKRLKQKP